MAVNRVRVFKLPIGEQFARLTDYGKLYAHHMARAAWYGTRIILRQVSPESPAIYEFILELYRSCDGDWEKLLKLIPDQDGDEDNLDRFLEYAAVFLSNVGNYCHEYGNAKLVPIVSDNFLKKLASITPQASELYDQFAGMIATRPPYAFGYPSNYTQSSYYLGDGITEEEIVAVSKSLEQCGFPEQNTRVKKYKNGREFDVLVASVEENDGRDVEKARRFLFSGNRKGLIKVIAGDHSSDLRHICRELGKASKYTTDRRQKALLEEYMGSFHSGSLERFLESQKIWLCTKAPRVESIFGFLQTSRDPLGIRAEFEGLVGIANDEETSLLSKIMEMADSFIRRLPWVVPLAGDHSDARPGKGPFEEEHFEPRHYSSIHTLAHCSNSPRDLYQVPTCIDFGQEVESTKNVLIGNRIGPEPGSATDRSHCPFIDASETEKFMKNNFWTIYLWLVFRQLFGQGTERVIFKAENGGANFDIANPPLNPLTSEPISSWYVLKAGQTPPGVFGNLWETVYTCRATLMGAYLMHETELVETLGLPETTGICAADCKEYLTTLTSWYGN